MATGRIRRTAQRGIAAAVLGWLVVAAFAVLGAPSAAASPAVTIEIKNLTPPAASVDPGGTVTFVNKIPQANKGGISIPLVGSVTATVYTDVAVTFFNQEKKLQLNQSAAWAFSAPATTGTITYTYRIVPQAGLSAAVANQVVDTVASSLPPLPARTPYVVQTIAPALPNLPSVNLPALPQVDVEVPGLPGAPTPTPPGQPPVGGPGGPTGQPTPPPDTPGDPYAYPTAQGAPRLTPSAASAGAAFDPSRWSAASGGSGGFAAGSSGSGGSGGVAGGYDGATVPVFGELAGLDSAALDEEGNATNADSASTEAAALPAAALAAVVALAAVTAALVRTHQASRTTR